MVHPFLKRRLLALPLALAVGCHPREGRAPVKQRELMHTSFEELAGWSLERPATLSTAQAHTGKYSLRIDAEHEYSATYHSTLGALCSHQPRRLTLGAWVWVPSEEADPYIVLSITNPNEPTALLYKYVYLTGGPYQQWKYVSRDFDVPGNVNPQTQLAVYLWKPKLEQPVYADDMQLTELW